MAQYFHYGRWRRVIVREHPETASFRYLAPPAARWLTAGQVDDGDGQAGVTAVGTALARGVPATVRIRIPVVLAAMHMAWGAGFLTSPRGLHRKSDTGVGQSDAATKNAAAAGAE